MSVRCKISNRLTISLLLFTGWIYEKYHNYTLHCKYCLTIIIYLSIWYPHWSETTGAGKLKIFSFHFAFSFHFIKSFRHFYFTYTQVPSMGFSSACRRFKICFIQWNHEFLRRSFCFKSEVWFSTEFTWSKTWSSSSVNFLKFGS